MKIVVVIPARAGSKSVPLKNIQPLGGVPLVVHSIRYALACPLVGRVVVSTDSNEIGAIAVQYGAEVPFLRPSEISGDLVEDFPVIEHALSKLEEFYCETIDVIVLLRPTSPLRPPALIEAAIEILESETKCTSVRAVVPSIEHPYRQWVLDGKFMRGYVSDIHEPYNLPRQKLMPLFFQSGDIEVIRRQTILDGSISGKFVMPLVIDRAQMLDIDSTQDLDIARIKIKS